MSGPKVAKPLPRPVISVVPALEPNRVSTFGVTAVTLLLSLFDFYIPALGLRPFDALALGVAIVGALLWGGGRPAFCVMWTAAANVVALISMVAALCLSNEINLSSYIGIVIGFTFLYLWGGVIDRANSRDLSLAIERALQMHAIAFVAMFVWHRMVGSPLDLHSLFGSRVKGLEDQVVQRSGGLFREPSNYSFYVVTSMWMLYRLRGHCHNAWIYYLTVIASFSAWGIVSGLAFMLMTGSIFRAVVGIGSIAIVIAIAVAISEQIATNLDWLSSRFLNVSEDGSFMARYGGGGASEFSVWGNAFVFQDDSAYTALTHPLYGMGALGCVVIASWAAHCFAGSVGASLRNKSLGAVMFLLIMIASPRWSYLYFYFIVALTSSVGQVMPHRIESRHGCKWWQWREPSHDRGFIQ